VSRYLARRFGEAGVVVAGVMILTFVMIHIEPGNVARSVLGVKATPTRIAIFDDVNGLNEPLWRQFVSYVNNVCHGNLGTSYQLQEPVSTLIAQRLPRDAVLLGISTLLALAVALPVGMYQAVKRNKVGDYVLTGVSLTLYSIPDFLFAILLIAALSIQFHVFPPEAPQADSVGGMLADPRALVLPVLTLSLISVASFSRYMRASAIEALTQDYINVARAKGLQERLVLLRHVLRNSLLPIVTLVGLSLPSIVAGAVIAEEVFNFPGMGLLFFQAATSHDFPILLGSTLVVGIATVLGNLAADVAYGILDPRIRHANV